MSLRANVDLTLMIDKFRNIGMYNQGIYYLEYKFYYKIGEVSYFALPYSNHPLITNEKESGKKKKEFHSLSDSELTHYPPSYRSKCFYI